MDFHLSIHVVRSPEDVFAFLRDKDALSQEPGSPVLVLERTTPGEVGVGTRYREVVQMFPFVRGEILSEITRFEPGSRLEEDFSGAGMEGHLAYRFEPESGGTRLVQNETVRFRGALALVGPLMGRMLGVQLQKRLDAIKAMLDSGRAVDGLRPSGDTPDV